MYASLKKYVVFQYERTQDSFCVISTIEDKFPFFVLSGHFGTQSEAMHHILKYNRWSKRNYICLRPQTSLLHLIYFFLHYVKSGNPSLDMVQVSRVVGHSLPWPAHSRTFDNRQQSNSPFSRNDLVFPHFYVIPTLMGKPVRMRAFFIAHKTRQCATY